MNFQTNLPPGCSSDEIETDSVEDRREEIELEKPTNIRTSVNFDFKSEALSFVRRNNCACHTPVELIEKRWKRTKSYVKFYGRHQHRVEAEKMLGCALLPGEIVHHKDGNKRTIYSNLGNDASKHKPSFSRNVLPQEKLKLILK